MPDSTTEFFDKLGRRDCEPRLEWTEGTIRFDIREGQRIDRWLVRIARGILHVSRGERPADVIVAVDRAVFGRILEGQENVYAAWLRDELRLEGGNPTLFHSFWRFPPLFPGPPGGHHPRSLVEARDTRESRS